MSEYDVVIIGGGAAGLSAALVLARARRGVLVVDSGLPRNAPAAQLHGYLSRDGYRPADLLADGRGEVRSYGGEVVAGTVTGLSPRPGSGFDVVVNDGTCHTARRLLVATGLRDVLPDVEGIQERWGRDVLHCPYCHGYEVRDQRLAVLGGTPESVRYAQIVRQWADDVVLVIPAGVLTGAQRTELLARAIGVVEGTVSRIVVENDRLRGVALDDGRSVPRDVVFVPPRLVPNADLLTGLGCDLDADGWVRADATGRTSVAGVWVAGNLADARAQLITAAGEGSAAAIAINGDLVDDDVARAVRLFDLGLPA